MEEPRGHRVGRLSLFGAFASAAARYWLTVFPRVTLELRHWRRSANRIADPRLRQLALASLGKRGNMEGAAAFATFAPWQQRGIVIRALVAFQAIYNYADMLAEQPTDEPVDNARDLHQALLVALDRSRQPLVQDAPPPAKRGDGDYLAEMIAVCEAALWRLPSYGAVAATMSGAAERIVAFQSLSLGQRGELESWAGDQAATGAGRLSGGEFSWWEVAAAAGSSLSVHALIAAAASPELSVADIAAIDVAYFPCIGALHSLLDSLVDEQEDAATGQLRLLDCYPSRPRAAEGMERLATDAIDAARRLPNGSDHALLVVAMACSYLAAPEASASGVDDVSRRVRASLGELARPMLLVFKLRRLAGARGPRSVPSASASTADETTPAASVGAETRDGNARAA